MNIIIIIIIITQTGSLSARLVSLRIIKIILYCFLSLINDVKCYRYRWYYNIVIIFHLFDRGVPIYRRRVQ